jgi:hypothetical protein
MKQNETKLRLPGAVNWYFVIAMILLVGLQECKCKHPIVFKEKVKAVHGISFFDVNGTQATNVRNVRVTIIDPGKMILSANGVLFEHTELSEGVMSVGLSAKAQVSAERPYRFCIRAEADGYMTNIRSIVITDTLPNSVSVFMAKLDSSGLPQTGLAAAVGNLTSVSGGVVTKDEVLTASLPNHQLNPLTIKIPKGTRLYYGDSQVDSKGDLSFRILLGAAGDSIANRVFPSGFEVTDAFDQNGKKIAGPANPVFFTTAGWFSMEMNVGNKEVNRFSDSLEVEIPIADSTLNPITQLRIKSGDKIPIWSLDNRTGTWRLESEVLVSASTAGLKANVKINHLSTFNLDYFSEPTCDINVPFSTAEFSGLHYSEFIRSSDNSLIKGKVVDYSSSPLSILKVPTSLTAAQPGKIFVHQTSDIYSHLIGGRQDLICGFSGGNIQILGNPGFPSVTIVFQKESGGTVVNNTVFHRPNISTPGWANMGNLDPSTGLLAIPQDSHTNQQLLLWYVKPPQVNLIFTMNFTSSGSGIVTDGATTVSFNYTVVSPGPGGSQSLITITIPSTFL